ncbi:MAG: hypothetical protein GVY13_07960 [Alphaproteobacteria bacterium]|jgi:PiT family inorganic phosphate transporter|nr:hypothetical protein [Alphaproteobacteria bacterium]
MDWLVGELWIVLLLAGFAIGANEAVTGLASLVAARTLPVRLALLCAAAATAVAVLLLAGPEIGGRLLPLFTEIRPGPAADAGAAPLAVTLAVTLATLCLVMLAASVLGQPVPAALVLAAALAGAVLGAGGAAGPEGQAGTGSLMAGAWGETAVLVAATAFGVPLLAALLAGAAGALLPARMLGAPRPRDRLRRLAPFAAGLTALAAVWLCLASFDAGLPQPLWLWAAVSLAAALAAGFAMHRGLATRPFAVADDRDGVEDGHARLQIAGSLLLAAAQGGHQALLVTVPAALVLGGSAGLGGAGTTDMAGEAWLAILAPLAAGLFAGILLLGHRTARRAGAAMAGLTASRGTAANLGAMIGLAGTGLAGLPMLGGQAAVGAAAGAALVTGTLRVGPLLGILAGWLAAPALAGALAWALMQAGG